MIPFIIPTRLENDRALLLRLEASDFDKLYAVASDPKIWEQHPQPDRWKESVFRAFFDGAIDSRGAFKIVDKETGSLAGSTRFYNHDPAKRQVFVGYTFYGTAYWGTGLNASVKKIMLDYAFQYVDTVCLHVGSSNFRSQRAVEKLGARKVTEEHMDYHGSGPTANLRYEIHPEDRR